MASDNPTKAAFEEWFGDNISDSGIAPEHEACWLAWQAGWRACEAQYPGFVLNEAQSEALLEHLSNAKPPTGEERIKRQRELYEAAKRVRLTGNRE